tara:strand:+ start:56186 stop:56305 length:120 start_codon:yes stop_codon:yes gene_type:complete
MKRIVGTKTHPTGNLAFFITTKRTTDYFYQNGSKQLAGT